ncbi:PAS domain S-box protein [Balneolaceae bacterium YR4-1]|uniref:histidine kinase n=1 Tax=Halalkalibaculum roseum TaxID=2709311 RepID=A0A6M1SS78_9BACT|nr:PAS domain S-box protein [Halalkalibaculum roseum]NGP75602.1 PAS domain S-box protein [Halalkalibaculum roseum]
MANSYQIVLLEDDSSDAELIQLHLQKVEQSISVTVATNKAQYLQALKEVTPDLIISDYNLPDINGIEAYEITKEDLRYIPFVLISGYIGEKKAAGAIKIGIHDYVMKDNLDRLPTVVYRLLAGLFEARLQQQKDQFFKAIFNTGEIGIAIIDESLNYTMVNDSFAELSGFTEEELMGMSALELNLSESHQNVQDKMELVFQENATLSGNWLLQCKDQVLRSVHSTLSLLQLDNDTKYALSLVRDITKEQQVSRLRRQVEEISGVSGWEYDVISGETYHTPMAGQIYELSPRQMNISADKFIEKFDESSQQLIHQSMGNAIEYQQPYDIEVVLRTPSNQKKIVNITGKPIVAHGKTLKISGTMVDITDKVESEQELKKLSMVASHTQNGVIITDKHKKIDWVNKAYTTMTGYSFEESVGRNPSELLHGPETNLETKKLISEKLKKEVPFTEEVLNYRKNGEKYWINLNITPVLNDQGQLAQFIAIQEDVTERKNAELELLRSEERLREAHHIGKLGYWDFNVATGEVFWSDNMYEIYERDKDQGVPSYEEVMEHYPDEKEFHKKAVEEAVQEGIPYRFDIKMVTPKGNTKFLHVEGLPITDNNGNVTDLHGVVSDITERKIAENELKASENKLKEILRNVDGMFQEYKIYPDGSDELIYVNGAVESLHELTAEEVRVSTDKLWKQVIEEDKQNLKESIQQSAKHLTFWDHKYRIETPSGKRKWIQGRGKPQLQEDGTVLWDTLKIDVTEQEEAKAEREGLYHLIEQSVSEIYIFDQENLQFLYVNEAAINNLGYTLEELNSMSPLDLKTDFSGEYFLKLIKPLKDGEKEVVEFETIHTRADESNYPVSVYIRSGEYKGKCVFVAHIIDETEKKTADERLHSLIEIAPMPIFIESSDGKVTGLWNEAAEKVLGFTKKEALGSTLPHVNTVGQVDSYKQLLKKIQAGKKVQGAEAERMKKDGTIFPARIHASPFLDAKGEVDSILVMLEDVTEEKKIKDNLQNQVQFSRQILDSMPGLFYLMNRDLEFELLNKNAYEFFGISEEDLQNISPYDLIAPEVQDDIAAKIQEVLATGYAEIETVMVAGGEKYQFFINGSLMEQNGDKYILGNGINITERVKSQKRNEVLIKEVHHRVKNNLAIISGMLELELFDLNDGDEKIALPIQRSRSRIQSIARVHELIYGTEDLSSVNLHNYINTLSQDLKKSIMPRGLDIRIETDITRRELNINSAVPLGLLLNELMTNSMKYAFEEKGKIEITITFLEDKCQLDYKDNGKGFEEPFNLETARSTGMVIMKTLINQLGGDYELDTKGGFHLRLRFEPNTRGSHSNL